MTTKRSSQAKTGSLEEINAFPLGLSFQSRLMHRRLSCIPTHSALAVFRTNLLGTDGQVRVQRRMGSTITTSELRVSTCPAL